MIQKPKGTYDVTGKMGLEVRYLEKLFESIMEKYHYQYIRTPIFEVSNLFHRTVGETSDIVKKETYDFKDKGNRDLTLRPEGTAGVVRSFIENKMASIPNQPVKTWYMGPMYRYERPQAGRFREFYQFGVEVFGDTDSYTDAEVISIPVNYFKMLGLKNIKVKINSLGDKESKEKYRKALLVYFKPYLASLCDDCKERYVKNPLRILDCKIDKDQDFFKKAPKTIDYLNEESKKHLDEVIKYLKALEIDYIVDSNIVRGLDYYTHTVFEVEALIPSLGNQNVLCGGGRYDNLVKNLDGPATKGVGFALGMERLLDVIHNENIKLVDDIVDIYVVPMSENTKEQVTSLVQYLRLNGFVVETDYLNRNLKGNFKQIDRLNVKYIIFVGEDEIKNQKIKIKNNHTKEEYQIEYDKLIDFLDDLEGSSNEEHI